MSKPPPHGATTGKQEQKRAIARNRICRAVTECLVEHGYADTSINRVVECAGVSKGALQHHFPSKEDLMAATANWLLNNATFLQIRNTRRPRAARSSARELMNTWQKGANTDEFRALLEILVRMRTDPALKIRVAPELQTWHEQSAALTRAGYEAASGREDDVDLLMVMNACLIRGLVIQEQYTADPAYIARVIERWIEIAAPLLLPREADASPGSI